MKLLHNYFCLNNILFVFFYILFINSYAHSNEIDGIYSFKDVYIENESNNSLEAKTKGPVPFVRMLCDGHAMRMATQLFYIQFGKILISLKLKTYI